MNRSIFLLVVALSLFSTMKADVDGISDAGSETVVSDSAFSSAEGLLSEHEPEVLNNISLLAKTDSGVTKKVSFFNKLYEIVKEFSRVDDNYIEPQHYNYTVMLQNTNTYESYTLRNKEGQEVVLAPEMSFRMGPYVGWRWLVLGYTIDISHLFGDHRKQDWDISLYSNQIGVDLFYRRTGNGYKIRRMELGNAIDATPMKNVEFNGFNASIKGFNLYYIMNHKRFSYPAAFNQSTCQKVSCGSPLVGIGYTKHSLFIDVLRLNDVINDHIDIPEAMRMDSSLVAAHVNYTDFSISGGYAYNWVFAKNWLAAASLSMAVGYKQSTGDMERMSLKLRDFAFYNFNFEGVGRFGVVWNNTRWYSGFSAILHSYSYRKSQFSTNTIFGSLNFYVGYNFGDRELHHQRRHAKH